jgi:CBS domain-containing protein
VTAPSAALLPTAATSASNPAERTRPTRNRGWLERPVEGSSSLHTSSAPARQRLDAARWGTMPGSADHPGQEEVRVLDVDLVDVAPPPRAGGVAVAGPTVADVMIGRPKTLPSDASVAAARAVLADDHVVLVLLTEDGVLRGTLLREDLPDTAPGPAPALPLSRLTGRTVAPAAPLADVHELLVRTGRRRLAVVDEEGRLLGLVCLKRRRTGYCTDSGVAERARSRRCAPEIPAPTR